MGKGRQETRRAIRFLEYLGARALFSLARLLPLKQGHRVGRALGYAIYTLLSRRRAVALENLRRAFQGVMNEQEIRRIARASCDAFVATIFEAVKLQPLFNAPDAGERLRESTEGLDLLFQKAREIHEASGGCIFVTPHLGNWEFLPHVGTLAGIPLVIVVRPLDNPYLERWLYTRRSQSGQIVIPKKNALYLLQKTLRQGKSIGLLPDQSVGKGIPVEYFGRPAMTTPIPAMLALLYHRPIVVVACCRKPGDFRYEGFVSDPIRPRPAEDERAEIDRLTTQMNLQMEAFIRKYPEQYLWLHNRWKTYGSKASKIG
jgi:KDO2-lipid IV(A) lauroyltransferase